MPLKSWAFKIDGHPVRAEIWWRFHGWSRQTLYIDHRTVVRREGWFDAAMPMTAEIGAGCKKALRVRFLQNKWGLDKSCEVIVDGVPLRWEQCPVQIEKKRQHSASSDGMTGVVFENPALGCLVLPPLFFLMICLLIPWAMIALPLIALQKWKLRRHLHKNCRLAGWQEIEGRILAGPSTLIFEIAPHGTRVWWTEDDVLARSPLPLPEEWQMMFHPRTDEFPFIEWCYCRYLSKRSGKAVLTHLPKQASKQFRFTDTGLDPQGWKQVYPLLNVVVTGEPKRKRHKAACSFVSYLGENLAGSVPTLISGIQNENEMVRKMCLEALRLAGPAAVEALPLLTDRLYFGPWPDRWSVASILPQIGAGGVDVLKEAARCGDPYICGPAVAALAMHERLAPELKTP